ncbi:MAG: redoxin domain-containing protein, partial [Lentisphaeria bacterium]|nr:redoxin domain-containing protein [Lentisphaeria bacterium]
MKRGFLLGLAVMLLLASAAFAENEKIEKSWQEELFGTELVNAQGQTMSSASLNDKIVAIYFSAHWCPPCRAFTPQLVQFCNELKAQQKAFEIVFISYDRDEESMRNYMTETKMPWLAIPYKSAKRTDVMKWFQVNQIPTLFVLNKKGQLISTNAREEVTEKGTKIFDLWEKAEITPEDIWYEKYFGKQLTNARGENVATDILRGKIVGIYHSASWCGPCRNFTPELVKFHNAQKKLHNNFEIVLLCEDETKEAMQAYMKNDKMA